MASIRYVIITPVRNEELYLPRTIESVASQSVIPAKWVIVDDGSTDGTGQVIDAAAKQHDWILPLHRANRGFRSAGSGVMEAFFTGFNLVKEQPWDFLVKLDGDVTFEGDYFERCFARFSAEPRLGIGGGLICNPVNGSLVPESTVDPAFHVRGATKIYRRECWMAIGGLPVAPGWDTVDEVKANMLGWITRTFPDIKLVHHRLAGRAYGTWSNWAKNGRASFFSGYHPLFMLMKCLSRALRKPYGIAGLALGVGYCGGYFRQAGRINDAAMIGYFRRQQFNRLLGRPSLWDDDYVPGRENA